MRYKADLPDTQTQRSSEPCCTSQRSLERDVRELYSLAARKQMPELCCPVNYDPAYLRVIPQEVIERDYGCGDLSRYVREGDTVLDLGSGSGKICFISAQIVGSGKRVGDGQAS